MKPELDTQLCTKYPKMFKNRNGDMTATCMCWGFECGDGWFLLLDTLCEALTYSFTTGVKLGKDEYVSLEAPQVVVDQVKEKYGSLRFYYHLEFDAQFLQLREKYPDNTELTEWASRYQQHFDGAIHYAETLSSRTCEETGLPGVMHTTGGKRNGWYKVLNSDFALTDPFCISRNYKPVTK